MLPSYWRERVFSSMMFWYRQWKYPVVKSAKTKKGMQDAKEMHLRFKRLYLKQLKGE